MLCKIFVVFKILEVKYFRFWPLKSLITYCMTFIKVWLAPDCRDEHFLFYNLSQNINSLKNILQIVWTFLGPIFKRPPPSVWYQKICTLNSCSTTVQKFLTILEISEQVSSRGWTYNSLKGPDRNKLKIAYCSEIYSEQLLFYTGN